MPSDTVHLVHARLNETPPSHPWTPVLPAPWRDRLARMRHPTARRRTLAGLWALREAACLAGWPAPSLSALDQDAGGRPVLPGGPAFSISHSGHRVACVVADAGELGVDIERVRPIDVHRFRRFLGPQEASADPRAFFTAWTAREATVKADGKVGLARIARVRLDGASAEVDGKRWGLRWLYPAADWIICVATPAANVEVAMHALPAPPV